MFYQPGTRNEQPETKPQLQPRLRHISYFFAAYARPDRLETLARAGLHLRHHPHRRDWAGHHHSGGPQAYSAAHGRGAEPGGRVFGLAHVCLRGGAVLLRAGGGRAQRQAGAAAGAAGRAAGAGARLRVPELRAHAGLAVCGARAGGHHRSQLHHGHGLHCRHQHAREAGPELWAGGRGLRGGLRHRAGHWGAAGGVWGAGAVYGGGGPEFVQRAVRLLRAARVAAARQAPAV